MGENNPMFSKTLSEDQKKKQQETLLKNHPDVSNAFGLAVRRTKTRPQLAIFEYLSKIHPNFDFQIEKRITMKGKEIYADIVSFRKKIVIEFNGDYWHCNPATYKSDFFHHVKKLSASDIWAMDEKRLETITSLGYRIIVIWEREFRSGEWKDTLHRWLEKNAKEDNFDVIRPSVNNYSSADVKLGELLESRGTDTTA